MRFCEACSHVAETALTAYRPAEVVRFATEVSSLSSGEGADRVAWSRGWERARALLRERLEQLPVEIGQDAAGNLHATLRGADPATLLVGSHLDSVAQGGPLDGVLGIAAGVELLRAASEHGQPPITLRLVDWADEEGVRFGQAMYGSAAATGALDLSQISQAVDRDGDAADAILAQYDVAVRELAGAPWSFDDVVAYLELHIEQGPILDSEDLPLGAVSGTVAVRRLPLAISGRSEHVGPPPLESRRDAMLAFARVVVSANDVAREHGGRSAVTIVHAEPNSPTSIVGAVEASIDLRHDSDDGVAAMCAELRRRASQIGALAGCSVRVGRPSFEARAGRFDEQLVAHALELVASAGGRDEPMVSGALHDATHLSRKVPAAMIFCRSIGGISHAPEERSSEEDVLLAARTFAELCDRVIAEAAR